MDQRERDKAIRDAIHERLLKRAVTDLEFRRLLIDYPKSALARELGFDIPDNIHVTVLPESEDHMFIVIPPVSSETDSTGVSKLAHSGPAYQGPMSATGVDRLAQSGPGYGASAYGTGIDRLAKSGPGYGASAYGTGIDRLAQSGPGYGASAYGTGIDRLAKSGPGYGASAYGTGIDRLTKSKPY
jgi:hypothetical protein